MSDENGSKPTFNFSQTPRRWGKRWRKVNAGMIRAAMMADSDLPGDFDDLSEDKQAKAEAKLNQKRLKALDDIDRFADEREVLISQVIVDVPRDWLVPDAPDGIDWNDVESLDLILEMKSDSLMGAVTEARTDDSKN